MGKLIIKVKYSPVIYRMYKFIGSTIFKFFRIFIKPNQNNIMFVSFGGKKYDDSPMYIYEEMMKDARFDGMNKYWALSEISDYTNIDNLVKIDSFKYYYCLLKCKYWITNSSVERGLDLKNNDYFCINTWHGTPLKIMGEDLKNGNDTKKISNKLSADIFLVQSDYELQIFSRAFLIPKNNIKKIGLPRNDKLGDMDKLEKKNILKKLGITDDKKIILFAPTYRDYKLKESTNIYSLDMNIDLWQKELGDKYHLLIRGHYEISSYLKKSFENSSFITDVSDYSPLNDLLEISDMLITDYSSIMFDYSLLKKPIYLFQPDYEKYLETRGLYFNINNWLPSFNNDAEIISEIKNNSYNYDKVLKFSSSFIEEHGNSVERLLDYIHKI